VAYLVTLKGSEPGRRLQLPQGPFILGRRPDCNAVLPSDAVSRHHARILFDGQSHLIEDLSSRNGTFVNTNRITEPTPLNDNDHIRICQYKFAFHSEAAPPERPHFDVIYVEDADPSSVLSQLDTSSSGESSGPLAAVRAVEKLRAVEAILRTLSTHRRTDELLGSILGNLLTVFRHADYAYILLKDPVTKRLEPRAARSRYEPTSACVRLSRTVLELVMEKGQAVLQADAPEQVVKSDSLSHFRIRSIMCVPLALGAAEPIGIIWAHTESSRHAFTRDDLDLLACVANAATVSLENLRLHQDLLSRQTTEQDLDLAEQIQRAFLPEHPPAVPGYSFYAYYQAAGGVGGDYYDFIELPDNRIAVCLGDVVGKGMAAALMMVHLRNDVRYAAATHAEPVATVRAVHRALRETGLDFKFVTLLFLVLDRNRHTLTVVNAGHKPPLLRRASGQMEEIAAARAGLPLNLEQEADYACEEEKISLEPGTMLLAWTDGVNEAFNSAGEQFGDERLRDAFQRAAPDPTRAADAVLRAVAQFTAGHPQSDDIALVCFGRAARE
jgi:serine phosphatase RsbU (regulator of sigma subunit)/pSer/pThr/pTyr-binding forkhead associated (FHA) protein